MENIQERPSERLTHDYTSELELKSLLIRIKNDRLDFGKYTKPEENNEEQITNKYSKLNDRINNRIKYHTELAKIDYISPNKKSELRRNLYNDIVRLSEKCKIDKKSYERFGEIIILMIQRILSKPNFCRYSYTHDFYSLSVYHVLMYLHNFDHTKISKISGSYVNAFAYISQYIHNSIIYIIKKNKKENDNQNKLVKLRNIQLSNKVNAVDLSTPIQDYEEPVIEYTDIYIKDGNLLIEKLKEVQDLDGNFNLFYPKEFKLTLDIYAELNNYMRPGINILQYKE